MKQTLKPAMFTRSMNKKTPGNIISRTDLPVAGIAWQILMHTLIALLCGRADVQILNICPYPWTGNPYGRRIGHMNSDTGKMTAEDTVVLVSSALAVTRFRKPLVDYLLSGLEENDKWIRILAADLLGSAGDPRAIEYLKPLLVDRDRDLRIISAQAMDMIHLQQAGISRSQPDHCASCMIRLIAEEALTQHKPRG
jgi:hypothetical protein